MPIYWNSKHHHYWINIGAGADILFWKPRYFLTAGEIHEEYRGEFLAGYFLLDLECMGLQVATIFNVWRDFFVPLFTGGNTYEPVIAERYPVVARATGNQDSKMAIVVDNAPYSCEDDAKIPIDLKFEYFDVQDLMSDFRFKKEDIDKIIAIALGKMSPENPDEFKERPLTPKTENSYLRLIQALAEYAINGLTGKPNKDAGTILAALKSKNIECPVGDKALAGYLEKAQQISK